MVPEGTVQASKGKKQPIGTTHFHMDSKAQIQVIIPALETLTA